MGVIERRRRAIMAQPHLVTVESGNTEYSTHHVHITCQEELPIKSIVIDVQYTQDGITEVTARRTGKNIMNLAEFVGSGVTYENGIVTGSLRNMYGIASYAVLANNHFPLKPTGIKYGYWSFETYNTGNVSTSGYGMQPLLKNFSNGAMRVRTFNNSQTTWGATLFDFYADFYAQHAVTPDVFGISYYSGADNIWKIRNMKVVLGTTNHAYEPYNGIKISASLPANFYGGHVDVVSGVAVSEYAADGTKLQTPETHQITPHNVNTLTGINNIWSDNGTVTVKYWAH